MTITSNEKPKMRESLFPTISVKEALIAEQTKPLWKHGTELK